MSPVALVGELVVKWAQVTSFLRVASSYNLAGRPGWRLAGGYYSQSQMWAKASPLFGGQHRHTGGGIRYQGAGAEAPGVLSELSLLLLTVCSTSLQHWHLAPKVEQCWGQRSLRGQLVSAQDCAEVALAWQRLVVRSWCFHFCGPGLNPCWGTEIPQAE